MRFTREFSAGFAVFLFFPVICAGWLTGETETEGNDDAVDTTTVDSAETVSELNDAYASLLCDSDPELLGKLLTSDSTGLALQAAWEEVKQSMPRAPASPVRSQRTGKNKLNRVALARFIGFLEGRLRVHPPSWWEDHLCIAVTV